MKTLECPNFTAIDFETATFNRFPCQIGITCVKDGKVQDVMTFLIQPPANRYDEKLFAYHYIRPDMTADAPTFDKLWDNIKKYFIDTVIVAHNATFDLDVLSKTLGHYNISFDDITYVCTCELFDHQKLNEACAQFGICLDCHHDAGADSLACAQLFLYHQTGEVPPKYDYTPNIEYQLHTPTPTEYHKHITGDVLKKDLTNADPNNPFYDKKVVITGVFTQDRMQLAQILKDMGADVDTSITKRTSFVLMGDNAGPKKIATIEKLNSSGCNIIVLHQQELDQILLGNNWDLYK